MSTYQTAAPAKQGPDLAAWALVALVVAVVCGIAGWAIASSDVLSRDDLARNASLASQDGLVRGQAVGYRQGAAQGRRVATLRTTAQIQSARAQAQREGFEAGYQDGRAKAGDPNAYLASSAGAPAAGTYPAAGYEDILAAGLFGEDAPGYSDSAYGAYGFGAGATTPYLGATTPLYTSLGDDF
jgi:hypothetical protein